MTKLLLDKILDMDYLIKYIQYNSNRSLNLDQIQYKLLDLIDSIMDGNACKSDLINYIKSVTQY